MEAGAIVRNATAGTLREESSSPTLYGHFSVFNTWTTIDSAAEGRFLERISPGAFTRTLAHDRSRMKVLFQHGRDALVGTRPIATIQTLREDGVGGFYEARLFELDPLLMDGLRANVYGASFRFKVDRDQFVQRPQRSTYNPDGWPERTIAAVSVIEFGPVVWGAYSTATANVRAVGQSLTDEWLLAMRTPIATATGGRSAS